MEIRHLKLVKEVAEKGSLTKAMDTLYLSQSALSHQLKELEKQLGTPVFHRVNKKLVLTGAGRIMLDAAERILAELTNTEKAIKKFTSGDTGTIRIATECYTCYNWLPSLMCGFNKEFPNVEIEIFPEATNRPHNLILEGKLDLAITSDQISHPDLRSTELFNDELMACVPVGHPWASKPYVEPADFEGEQVIIHSFPLESVVLFRQLLIPEGIKPKKVIAVQVTEAIAEMVKANMGVKVVARWIIAPYLHDQRLALVPVTAKGLYRSWYAVTLNRSDTPQYLENFKSHLKCNIKGVCKTD